MHPSARLILWLALALSLQAWPWPLLLILAALLLSAGPAVRQRWARHLRRARWLLLSLWLILAYGLPGDAWLDLPYAPSVEGLYAAHLHLARLALLLGSLAWLFAHLDTPQLMAGLWSLLPTSRRLAAPARQLVVRLALVFDFLEQSPARGSWRHFLEPETATAPPTPTLRLTLPPWQFRDSLLAGGALLLPLLTLLAP